MQTYNILPLLKNNPFFLISRIRASHWKHIPSFAKIEIPLLSRKWVRAWYTVLECVCVCVCVCVGGGGGGYAVFTTERKARW